MCEDENVIISNYCRYASERRDFDGNWDIYCNLNGYCRYRSNVKDCDGDVISLCRMIERR